MLKIIYADRYCLAAYWTVAFAVICLSNNSQGGAPTSCNTPARRNSYAIYHTNTSKNITNLTRIFQPLQGRIAGKYKALPVSGLLVFEGVG